MAWRDELRPASFRGVPFHVRASDVQEGRRWVVHEFPSRNQPLAEDLGLGAGVYAFEAFVLGEDYFDARDALREACLDETAGELVHPYLGRLSVVCRGIRIREEVDRGRMARFQLEFTDSGEELPLEEATEDLVEDAADAATEASQSQLERTLELLGAPQWVIDGAVGATEAVQAVLEGVEELEGAADDVATWVEDTAALLDPFVDLAEAPFRLSRAITLAVARAEAAIGSRLTAAEIYLDWARSQFGSDRDGGSARDAANLANQAAIQGHFRVASAAAAVRSASGVAWQSFDQAAAYQRELQAALDELLTASTDDDVSRELEGLRAALALAVPPADRQLPRIQVVRPVQTVPSLVLAYRIYGDAATWEPDLVARNEPPHPAFLAGGVELEVLVS